MGSPSRRHPLHQRRRGLQYRARQSRDLVAEGHRERRRRGGGGRCRHRRFTAATSSPIPWEDVSWFPIMSKAWTERHGAGAAIAAGDDRWDYVETHANGTGPFVLEEFEPGERTVLVRNANWWGLAQHPHNIDRIVQTRVADPAGAPSCCLHARSTCSSAAGGPARADRRHAGPESPEGREQSNDALPRLRPGEPRAQVLERQGRNPFADRRVRQAFYQGIDIGRIIEALHGLAVPAGMLIWPKGIGWSEELDRRLPYDPAKAKALLAEAGYPEGFDVRFDCPANREPACAPSVPRCRRSASGSTSRSQPRGRPKDPDPRDRFLLVGLRRAVRFGLVVQSAVSQRRGVRRHGLRRSRGRCVDRSDRGRWSPTCGMA